MDFSAKAMRQVVKEAKQINNDFYLKVILEEMIYPAAKCGEDYCTVKGEWWNTYANFSIAERLKEMGYKLSTNESASLILISWKEGQDDKEIHSPFNKPLR